MEPLSYEPVARFFSQHEQFVICSHVRPDGDAYGTSLGLAQALEAHGKRVSVWNEDGLLPAFRFLAGAEAVGVPRLPCECPLIAVDTSTYERLGATVVGAGLPVALNLDHHESNTRFGGINWVDATAPASAQVATELLLGLGISIPPAAASNLYVGLLTDTGCFRYRGTTARTLEIAALLVAAGADPSELADACYRRDPKARFLLQCEVMAHTQFVLGDRVAYYILTPELLQRAGATSADAENFLDTLQSVASVELAFMLEAQPDGFTRASLRSRRRISVGEIAAKFGGGGHPLAAGIRSTMGVAELREGLLKECAAALGRL